MCQYMCLDRVCTLLYMRMVVLRLWVSKQCDTQLVTVQYVSFTNVNTLYYIYTTTTTINAYTILCTYTAHTACLCMYIHMYGIHKHMDTPKHAQDNKHTLYMC